jgi:hypothetical protein
MLVAVPGVVGVVIMMVRIMQVEDSQSLSLDPVGTAFQITCLPILWHNINPALLSFCSFISFIVHLV